MLLTIVIVLVVAGIVAYRVSILKKAKTEDSKSQIESEVLETPIEDVQPKKELILKDRPKQETKPKQKAEKPKQEAKKQEAKEPKKESKSKPKNKK